MRPITPSETTDAVRRLTFEEDVTVPVLLGLSLLAATVALGLLLWRGRSSGR